MHPGFRGRQGPYGLPDWQYDEFSQCGADHANAAEVEPYDAQM